MSLVRLLLSILTGLLVFSIGKYISNSYNMGYIVGCTYMLVSEIVQYFVIKYLEK